jgi:hypothetical protein
MQQFNHTQTQKILHSTDKISEPDAIQRKIDNYLSVVRKQVKRFLANNPRKENYRMRND